MDRKESPTGCQLAIELRLSVGDRRLGPRVTTVGVQIVTPGIGIEQCWRMIVHTTVSMKTCLANVGRQKFGVNHHFELHLDIPMVNS